jgi:hypothetical protein
MIMLFKTLTGNYGDRVMVMLSEPINWLSRFKPCTVSTFAPAFSGTETVHFTGCFVGAFGSRNSHVAAEAVPFTLIVTPDTGALPVSGDWILARCEVSIWWTGCECMRLGDF